jgi:hypothetical protein
MDRRVLLVELNLAVIATAINNGLTFPMFAER